jgi:hypothetical protein
VTQEKTKSFDPYRRIAGLYDRLFERMNKGLETQVIRLELEVEDKCFLAGGTFASYLLNKQAV